MSALLSFMHEYLDPFVKADECARYVDDIHTGNVSYPEISGSLHVE